MKGEMTERAAVRESRFELLRIVAMFLVLVVHADFLSLGGPKAADFGADALSAWTRAFVQFASIVCVDVFVLISGWFGIRASLAGGVKYVFQCVFLLSLAYCAMIAVGRAELSLWGVWECLVLAGANWFVKAYLALYILSPVLNAFLRGATMRQTGWFLVAFYGFQTVYGWTGASTFVCDGYSTFSFIGLYVLGHYLRCRERERGAGSAWHGMALYIACAVLNSLFYYVSVECGIGRSFFGLFPLCSYVNPLIVAGSAGLLLAFARQGDWRSGFVNWVGRSCFAVYLLHTMSQIFEPLFIPGVRDLWSRYDGVAALLAIGAMLVGVFVVSVLVDQLRIFAWNRLKLILFRR